MGDGGGWPGGLSLISATSTPSPRCSRRTSPSCACGRRRRRRRRRCWQAIASANTPRWLRPVRCVSPTRCELVRYRAEAMQGAVPEGFGAHGGDSGLGRTMRCARCASEAAAGRSGRGSEFQLARSSGDCRQQRGSERAMVLAKEKGAKRAVTLPVSVPRIPLCCQPLKNCWRICGASGGHHADDAGDSQHRRAKSRGIRAIELPSPAVACPVRWVETVRYL